MPTDTTMDIGLDLPEKGVDLAELVFDVAEECDVNCHSLDLNNFADELMIQIEVMKVRHENSHLSENELQNLVDSIIVENKRKIQERETEKAEKREKVKQRINGNALEGYELAYSLCGNDGSDEAKQLRYYLLNHLPNLSVKEKIEVSRLYAESLISHGERGNKIAHVYYQMARLVHPQNKRMNCSLCLSFYEKAYEYIDGPSFMLDGIIAFCNRFGFADLQEKCQQKKESLLSTK